jgi:hypothetical protein
MNDGVKLLLERMKTNPEEFTNGHKWVGLINSYKEYLNEEDAKVFNDAYNGLMQQTFTEQVMKELLAPEEDASLGKPWYTKQNVMPLAGATPVPYTVNASGTVTTWENREPLSEAGINQILATHKEIKQKKPKTLFGKLFNYT